MISPETNRFMGLRILFDRSRRTRRLSTRISLCAAVHGPGTQDCVDVATGPQWSIIIVHIFMLCQLHRECHAKSEAKSTFTFSDRSCASTNSHPAMYERIPLARVPTPTGCHKHYHRSTSSTSGSRCCTTMCFSKFNSTII